MLRFLCTQSQLKPFDNLAFAKESPTFEFANTLFQLHNILYISVRLLSQLY